ncbi:hypothetical protein Y032_0026g1414 [Ancylostoma ceylanicum]|uniref:Uncharacterized protein n=1 Tax=Ancylostoma ceylanicum TaxID=53326 RepID=A0A016UV57_9BILA|nr:hypothetical protein Y032_0026g1414 [Ancylostoma ceylanicum]
MHPKIIMLSEDKYMLLMPSIRGKYYRIKFRQTAKLTKLTTTSSSVKTFTNSSSSAAVTIIEFKEKGISSWKTKIPETHKYICTDESNSYGPPIKDDKSQNIREERTQGSS